MDIIFILLPASLLLALCAVIGFIWATRSGQFDDLETPQRRMLFDDQQIESDRTSTAREKRLDPQEPPIE